MRATETKKALGKKDGGRKGVGGGGGGGTGGAKTIHFKLTKMTGRINSTL